MKFNLVSIFPELINDYIKYGLLSKALEETSTRGKDLESRDFSDDVNGRIDDKPFGGGAGMLFKAEPIINTVDKIKKIEDTHVVFVAPTANYLTKKIFELKSRTFLH